MRPAFKSCARRVIGAMTIVLANLPLAVAGNRMPAAQQNALVEKYCAVCHNDAHMNGGLSLQHFDAAHADPGVAAMLLSKLTSGVSLASVNAAQTDPDAAAMLAGKMKTGAMGAAGLPAPDRATQDALVSALAAEAAGASAWRVNESAPILKASILREVPSTTNPGEANLYRLTLTCHGDTREADMQLSWAAGVPPKDQVMSAAVDGRAPVTYKVEGSEKMFVGASGISGTGATILWHSGILAMPLPAHTLTISNLFPDETVVFPFDNLIETARQGLSMCFSGKPIANRLQDNILPYKGLL